MLKSEEVLRAMDPDSTDIMRSGLLDKYLARPNEMENVCLAEFAANYNINSTDPCISKPHDDEDEEDREGNTEKTVTLLNGKGFVTQRKWAKVIRYCNFSILKDMKEHYREQLMLFHPWRDEQQDLIDVDHERKFKEHEQMIDEKRKLFVSDCDMQVGLAQEQQDADSDEEMIDGLVPIADLDAEEMGQEQDEVHALEDERGRQVDVMEEIGEPAK
ncbi:hypothetical protein ACOMHN_023344 [Nucella lapillus]